VATSTSNFGVGKRETHDASGFYARFVPPKLSDDATVLPPQPVEQPLVCGDARTMTTIADGTVALVVTSPPYFAGKQYEEELTRDEVPSSYVEYLTMLRDVFTECVRTLEPGGRIAVNVANLGRKPYRSLSSDVIHILQDDLGLLLRGEIIWRKAAGATGSCAWGSYRSPANPVLRDVTERIIVASKGRFDRAVDHHRRAKAGFPNEATLNTDDFLSLTLDMWDMPTESAKRVGHPAPFPVELADRLIRLYTYESDLVLDPFLGSGSTVVAASRLGRRYVGYDLDPSYLQIAQERLEREGTLNAGLDATDGALKIAESSIRSAGFAIEGLGPKIAKTGVGVDFSGRDANGQLWYFKVVGAHTTHRGGMTNQGAVWDTLGRLHAIRDHLDGCPVVLLTTKAPDTGSEAGRALRSAGPSAYFDVVDLTDPASMSRLARYGSGVRSPLPGWWPSSAGGKRSL
jgi:DNA modification methylase